MWPTLCVLFPASFSCSHSVEQTVAVSGRMHAQDYAARITGAIPSGQQLRETRRVPSSECHSASNTPRSGPSGSLQTNTHAVRRLLMWSVQTHAGYRLDNLHNWNGAVERERERVLPLWKAIHTVRLVNNGRLCEPGNLLLEPSHRLFVQRLVRGATESIGAVCNLSSQLSSMQLNFKSFQSSTTLLTIGWRVIT